MRVGGFHAAVLALVLAGAWLWLVKTQAGGSVVAVKVNASRSLGSWEGWGSSLAWWARAIGGTGDADFYADLIYTNKTIDGYPGLSLNIVRYNVGGGGIDQPKENKGPKLQWQMDIHGYWTDPNRSDPATWDWSLDHNQRVMMHKAFERGATVFQMFSDSPMWWMNSNRSTAGSDSGGDCLLPQNYGRFTFYLANVARYAADHWGIKFDSIEPFNEPSADWWKYPNRQEGCHFDVRTQQTIVASLRRALDRAHLEGTSIAAADENNIDAGLSTWNAYDPSTRGQVGLVDVHGYSHGTAPYRGPNRAELHSAVGTKRLWQSEYGDGDASGYTLAQTIVRDIKELQPSAWVYWQPVEPDVRDFGWGLVNANYVDTRDQPSAAEMPLVRVNRKFFVYGQFTRYIRPGYRMVAVDDPGSVAAYDATSHKLVIVKVTGSSAETAKFDLADFTSVGERAEMITTTTAPDGNTPDWKQHTATLRVPKETRGRLIEVSLYPKSVYTLVIAAARR